MSQSNIGRAALSPHYQNSQTRSIMSKAGGNIMGGPTVLSGADLLSNHKSIVPQSERNVNFKTTLDEIEADILSLA